MSHRVARRHRWVALCAGLTAGIARADTGPTSGPTSAPTSARAVLQELRSLASTGRVLMVAAHPDDENTQLITYLARGRHYAMAYLSVTRGDGGQNVLGPEFGDELGWVRTNELLAARRLDGGQQFFTRARDFGFSKSAAETLRIWDRPAVLGDVVRVIRTFRPDVIVTRFSPTRGGTHGHHTASAVLALEAFKLAADPAAYPEQLKTLSVWQAKRIVQNSGGPTGGGDGGIRMSIGGQDPVLNLSFGQIAARSRAMHQSQGFANYALNGGGGGQRTETFTLLGGEPAKADLMDGVDTTWARLSEPAAKQVDAVLAKFDPTDPAASVPALVALKRTVSTLPPGPVVAERAAQLDRVIQHCLGLTVETTTPAAEVTPGDAVPLEHRLAMTAGGPARLVRVEVTAGGPAVVDDAAGELSAAAPTVRRTTVTVPADHAVTQPYWLARPAATGLYAVTDDDLIGRPENPPAIAVACTVDVGGERITVRGEPRGPDGRRVEVVAPVSLAFPFGVNLFKPGTPRDVTVVATAHRADARGVVRLSAPAGWRVTPAERPFVGGRQSVAFTVTPPTDAGTAELAASVEVNGTTYDTGREEIRYAHLSPLLLQPRVTLHAVCADVKTAGHAIGYLPGAGDSVADCLREMGYAVTMLGSDDLDATKLARFDAVVVGVRAFNVRADLKSKAQALFDYAAAGGTVVEQYNRPDGLVGPVGPYPLRLSGSRITDEASAVTFLAPDHPALTVPNKITPADFDGWVQERGIYYPGSWDGHWTPLLGGNDAGEPRLDGGLLVARHGKGYVVYTGLVFFRELPAGVPGAYRLFANLVSLGKA